MLCDEITTSLSNLRDFSLDSLPHVCTYSTVLFMLGRMTSHYLKKVVVAFSHQSKIRTRMSLLMATYYSYLLT